MGLKAAIKLTSLSATADSFLLQETTGVYALDNLGGYGDPNIEKEDITSILIQLYNEGNSTALISYSPASIVGFLAGTAQTITVASFNSTGTFTDGVMHVKYYPLMASVTLSGQGTDGLSITSAAGFRSNEEVVVIGLTAYRVDTSKTNTPSILYLLDAIPAGTVSVLPGYSATAHILNTVGLGSKLAKKIGVYAGKACSDIEAMFLTKILLKKIGAEVRYDCDDLKGAQAIITTAINNLEGGCKC